MRVLVLGPCTVEVDGGHIELSSLQRRILTSLALRPDSPVGPDELADSVWSGQPPPTARAALQNQVSRLRRRLGAEAIRTQGGRYVLGLPTDVDAALSSLDRAESATRQGRPEEAVAIATAALSLWRGDPFADVDHDDSTSEALRRQALEALRSLETLRLDAAIDAGRVSWAVPEAERLVGTAPHDEHRWALLVRALDRAGRRGDALGAADRARRMLAADLGLQPGSEILAAEASVLQGDRSEPMARAGSVIGRAEAVGRVADAALSGQAVLLTGEPGIGKSCTLGEVARLARSRGALVGRAAFTLHPASATTTLGALLDDLGTEFDTRHPPVEAFSAALSDLASPERPVVVCVDDLDRAGPTSLAALRAAAVLADVGVVTTSDTDDPWPSATQEVIEPLSTDSVAVLAESIEGRPPDPDRLTWLVNMSGGNPTMVEYLLQSAAGSGAGLRGLVRSRFELLDRPTRWALEIAAVCGPRFPAALLGSLAPAGGIAGAAREGLLVELPDAGIRVLGFRHEAVQTILYEDLAPGRRAEVHHAATEVLVGLGAPPAQTAVHALDAAEIDRSAAIRWATGAAADAVEVGAFAEAADWHKRAARTAAGFEGFDRERVAATIGRADALRRSGSPDQETELFAAADAADELGDPDLIADAAFAVLQLGATSGSGSTHERAVLLADSALEVTEDPNRRALVAGAASLAHSMSGDSGRCRELFRLAVDWADEPGTRMAVLPFAYLGLGHPRDLDEREQLAEELLALATAADDPVSLFEGHQLTVSVAMQRADGERMRASAAAMAALEDRIGDVGRHWALTFLRAALAHLDGELELAETVSESAMALFADVVPSRALAVHGGQLLAIRIAQDRVGELAEILESLVEDQPGVPAWNAALALAVSGTDAPRAARLAEAALDGVDEDFTWLAAHLIGGRAAAASGDVALSERYLERLVGWSGLMCWQGSCCYGPVDTVLSLLHLTTANAELATAHAATAVDRSRLLGAAVYEDEAAEVLRRLDGGC